MKLPGMTLVGAVQPNTQEIINKLVTDARLDTILPEPFIGVRRYYVKGGSALPFIVDIVTSMDGKPCIFTDMRPYMGKDGVSRSMFKDYSLRDTHSKLLAKWIEGGLATTLLTDLSFAGIVFTSAIQMMLGHIYRLDGEQSLVVKMVLAQWWGMSIRKGEDYTDVQAYRDMQVYAGIGAMQPNDRLVTYCTIPYINTLAELADTLREKLNSTKTTNFNLTTFLTILKSLVFVYRSDVIIPLALEFPPMFTALVYLAMTDKTMRRSYLFTAVTNSISREKKRAEEFLPNMKLLIGD